MRKIRSELLGGFFGRPRVTALVIVFCVVCCVSTNLPVAAQDAQDEPVTPDTLQLPVPKDTTEVVLLKEVPDRLVRFYLGAGVSLPVTALSDQANTGVNATAAVGIVPRFMSSGDIEILLRGQYDKLPAEIQSRPDISFMSLGLDFKLNLDYTQRTNWYFIAGGGFTNTKWHEYEVDGRTRPEFKESHLYGEGGLGVELIRKPVTPYVQLRLSNVTGPRMGNYYFVRLQAGIKI